MARIRTIKPEFFTSEDIVGLSPLARLLYIATWCDADREGRLLWKPRTFKLRYFPGDECDVQSLCGELIQRGLIALYGDGLAYIPSFNRHQHINPRESKSTLPPPEFHASSTRHDASVTHREEGKGKEGKEHALQRGASSADVPDGFDAFWTVYPNRKAKQEALKAWMKLKPNEQLQESILKAVRKQSQGEGWRKEGGRFVPHPATWLNGRRWEDEGQVASAPAVVMCSDGAI